MIGSLATEQFDVDLSELELRLERLRALYEQYFLGIEKIEPAVARKDVDRRFWELRKVKVRNTAKRFKLQTLIQRYNTLQQYWMKICRQIENGTYVRHLARAKRRLGDNLLDVPAALDEKALVAGDPTPEEVREAFGDLARASRPVPNAVGAPPLRPPRNRSARPSEPTVAAPAPTLTSLNDKSGVVPPPRKRRASPSQRVSPVPTESSPVASEVTRLATPQRPPPQLPTPQRPTPQRPVPSAKRVESDLTEARIDHLHAELERARSSQDTPISRTALAKSLRAQEAKLRAKHEGKQVDFRIDVRDGKPVIKPVIKR